MKWVRISVEVRVLGKLADADNSKLHTLKVRLQTQIDRLILLGYSR
jgi:hypothetical protein